MIVKDEEEAIARCLESVRDIVDEIIIVDTGSRDKTKEIVQKYTDKIYDYQWTDHFANARNFSFSKASMDYCMWLDADDLFMEPDRQKLIELKNTMPDSTDMVMMPYHTAFDEDGNPTFSYYRERIVRNQRLPMWLGAIHEVIPPFGNILYIDAAVTHSKRKPGDPDRNLRIFEKQLSEEGRLSPREQFYYGRELYYHQRYQDAIQVLRTFLDSGEGWIENNLDACRILAYCEYGIGDNREALRSLLHSLEYDAPRAEICCDIGKHFFDRQAYKRAIFWYELALSRERDDKSGGFIIPDCYGYLPCIQLCVCYDRLGNREKANFYNEKAGQWKPTAKEYLYNRDYFQRATGDNNSNTFLS